MVGLAVAFMENDLLIFIEPSPKYISRIRIPIDQQGSCVAYNHLPQLHSTVIRHLDTVVAKYYVPQRHKLVKRVKGVLLKLDEETLALMSVVVVYCHMRLPAYCRVSTTQGAFCQMEYYDEETSDTGSTPDVLWPQLLDTDAEDFDREYVSELDKPDVEDLSDI